MADTFTAKRGRPPKPIRRRANLTLRIRDEIKEQLEEKARNNSCSISEEAEFRLERSFRNVGVLQEAMEMAYGGPVNADLLMLIGRELVAADQVARIRETHGWLDDRSTFDEVVDLLNRVFRALRPEEAGNNRLAADVGMSPEQRALWLVQPILSHIGRDRPAGRPIEFEKLLDEWGEKTREQSCQGAGGRQ